MFKKIAAGISAVVVASTTLMLTMVGTVSGAGVAFTVASPDRQTFTLDLPAGVDLAPTDDITLTVTTTADGSAVNLSANQATALTMGGNDEFAQVTNAGDANGQIVVTNLVGDPAADGDLVFTLTSALATDSAYTISYRDSAGNFGAAMINFGTSNQVSVSARVEPILVLALNNGTDGNTTFDFGTLTPGSFSEDDIQVDYATNAVSGLTISMASTGLKDTTIDREIGVQSIDATTDTTATDYYKVSTAGGTAAVTFDTTDNAITLAGGRDMRATQDVVTTAAPNAATNQMVTVGVQAAADTEAGNYTDTLTFTATATF